MEENFVEQRKGSRDRRQRLLYLTEAGVGLEQELSAPQKSRVARAYREAGPEAVAGYRKVLAGLINEQERARIIETIERA